VPTSHTVHVVDAAAPRKGEKVPAAHGVQLAVPVPLAYAPALHGAHAAAAPVVARPALQLKQLEDATAPVFVEYRPAAQPLQSLLPVVVAYWPAGQPKQLDAPRAEVCPAPQSVHTVDAVAPTAVENAPAGQVTQLGCAKL
jgi:hypothetical protein